MRQDTFSWCELPDHDGKTRGYSYQHRIDRALQSGIVQMVGRGRISLSRVGDAFRRFNLELSRVELLHICRQQGWEVTLEMLNKWSSTAEYKVRTRERAPLSRRPSSQIPRKEQ